MFNIFKKKPEPISLPSPEDIAKNYSQYVYDRYEGVSFVGSAINAVYCGMVMASCIAFMKHVADERIPSQERKKRAKGLIEEYLPLEEQINSHGRRLINDPVGEKIWEYCVTEADRVVRELKLGREPAIDVAGLEKAVDSLYGVSPFELLELMAA